MPTFKEAVQEIQLALGTYEPTYPSFPEGKRKQQAKTVALTTISETITTDTDSDSSDSSDTTNYTDLYNKLLHILYFPFIPTYTYHKFHNIRDIFINTNLDIDNHENYWKEQCKNLTNQLPSSSDQNIKQATKNIEHFADLDRMNNTGLWGDVDEMFRPKPPTQYNPYFRRWDCIPLFPSLISIYDKGSPKSKKYSSNAICSMLSVYRNLVPIEQRLELIKISLALLSQGPQAGLFSNNALTATASNATRMISLLTHHPEIQNNLLVQNNPASFITSFVAVLNKPVPTNPLLLNVLRRDHHPKLSMINAISNLLMPIIMPDDKPDDNPDESQDPGQGQHILNLSSPEIISALYSALINYPNQHPFDCLRTNAAKAIACLTYVHFQRTAEELPATSTLCYMDQLSIQYYRGLLELSWDFSNYAKTQIAVEKSGLQLHIKGKEDALPPETRLDSIKLPLFLLAKPKAVYDLNRLAGLEGNDSDNKLEIHTPLGEKVLVSIEMIKTKLGPKTTVGNLIAIVAGVETVEEVQAQKISIRSDEIEGGLSQKLYEQIREIYKTQEYIKLLMMDGRGFFDLVSSYESLETIRETIENGSYGTRHNEFQQHSTLWSSDHTKKMYEKARDVQARNEQDYTGSSL